LGWKGLLNLAILRMRPATPAVATSVPPAERVAGLVAAVAMAVAGLMVVGREALVRRAMDGSPSPATETGTRARVAAE
jgi:hypothetical protein